MKFKLRVEGGSQEREGDESRGKITMEGEDRIRERKERIG